MTAVEESAARADLGNVEVDVAVELGRKDIKLSQARQLQKGDYVELDKLAGEAFTVLVNGRSFAEGEIVVVTDIMALRITRMMEVPEIQEAMP